MVRSTLALAALASPLAVMATSYSLADNYDKSNFFQEWEFWGTEGDPTHGAVQYTDARMANDQGLAGYVSDQIYMGVDHVSPAGSNGRASVRISTKKRYTKGLFIADIAHMPVGCAVWPAFWSFGKVWPTDGEIDIIEGVNSASSNQMTLHTAPNCKMDNAGAVSSTTVLGTDCQGNQGCGQLTPDKQSYGPGFNAIGGGVYAMEWTSEAIKIWFFARGTSQASALSGNGSADSVDTSSFGQPIGAFGGSGCDIDSNFVGHQLVFDTTLCGDWAGLPETWEKDATCSSVAKTCGDYVASAAPGAWNDAYWLVNSVRAYTAGGSGSGSGSSSGPTQSAGTGSGTDTGSGPEQHAKQADGADTHKKQQTFRA